MITNNLLGSPTPPAKALVGSAQRQIALAMDGFAGEPQDAQLVYLSGGLSLEHLAKAVLAELNPVLLAHPQDFESQYLLASASDSFITVAPRLRTVGLQDALRRAARIVPELVALIDPLRGFVEQRNAAAHVGLTTKNNLDADVARLLQALSALLEHLGIAREQFFGDYAEVAARRVAQSIDERRARVQDRLDRARRLFWERWGDAPRDLDLGSGLHLPDWEDPETATLVECPACGTDAVAFGEIDVEVEVDYDHREGVPIGAALIPWFVAHEFRCRACGLQLGGDEMELAGLEERWVLDDYEVDPREYWGDYDDYR